MNESSRHNVKTRPMSESLSVRKTPLPTPGFSMSSSHLGSPRSTASPLPATALASDDIALIFCSNSPHFQFL